MLILFYESYLLTSVSLGIYSHSYVCMIIFMSYPFTGVIMINKVTSP